MIFRKSIYFLLALFILINISSLYSQIYISPSGNDNNPGTFDLPFRTLTKAITVTGPDSLILMRGGLYNESATIRLNKSGLENKYIKVWNYPGELPILDFLNQPQSTSSRGIQISHNYWHIKGIEIRNAKDNGIYISGWYNKVEACRIHHCEDTGLQISGNGSYNLVFNCDSYLNYDPLTHGENADGFAPKLDIGPGNKFYGCRAWGNSDDGWDMFEADELVEIDNCWAFANGFNIWNDPGYQGDGNGFKLGGNFVPAPQIITRSIAFDNKSKGFDQNNNTAGIIIYNNTAFRNQSRNYSFPSSPTIGNHILKNNISFQGSNSIAGNSEQLNNSWQGFNITSADFVSLDTSLAKSFRNSDSTLPVIDFLKLNIGSSLIDAGVDVGLPFNGSAPDLGAFEFDGIVPVELLSLTGNLSGSKIILIWKTASELNNYGFEIEKLFNGLEFKTIGFVPGNGTTAELNEYLFTIDFPQYGLNIFRLKQIDFSGKYVYSNEVQVIFNSPQGFKLLQNYPNPFNPSTLFNYEINSPGIVNLEIFNLLGEKIASLVNEFQNPGSYLIEWQAFDNFGNLMPSGIYFAQLRLNDQNQSIKIYLIK
jgi:hypothetical protein